MSENLFIYHGGCFDGFTAAYLWWENHPEGSEWEYHGATHGDMPRLGDVEGRHVMMVDFTYTKEEMTGIAKAAKSLVVLDHHATAETRVEAARREGADARFDNARCGACMLWEYMVEKGIVQGADRPHLLDHIEDRDLWKMEHPNTKYVSAYVAAQPMTFVSWSYMFQADYDDVYFGGKAIHQYIEQYGRKAREHAHMETIGGLEVPVMNLPYMNCSEHVTALLEEHPDRPFAAGYFQRKDRRWQFSLRSRGDFDVGEFAQTFGGGGHKGAAGFDIGALPWSVGEDDNDD